MIIVKFRLFFS